MAGRQSLGCEARRGGARLWGSVCSTRVGAGRRWGGGAGGCGVETTVQTLASFSPFVPSVAIAPLRPLQNRRLLGRGALPAILPLVLHGSARCRAAGVSPAACSGHSPGGRQMPSISYPGQTPASSFVLWV